MAFRVPSMPLMCNIWHKPHLPPADPPDVVVRCNLSWGRRVNVGEGAEAAQGSLTMSLLLPPLTDVRSWVHYLGGAWDYVEVPAGSQRFYTVADVDDIGKGFLNEHRCAVLIQSVTIGPWPAPIP